MAGDNAFRGVWCWCGGYRLGLVHAAIQAQRPQVGGTNAHHARRAVPTGDALDALAPARAPARVAPRFAGSNRLSGKLAKRLAAPRARPHRSAGPHTSTFGRLRSRLLAELLAGVCACSLVVQMAITATVCMWLMYAQPVRSGTVTASFYSTCCV